MPLLAKPNSKVTAYEIDMISLNEFDHTGVAAEIKRNPRKISLTTLQDKVNALPSKTFGNFSIYLRGLIIKDIS